MRLGAALRIRQPIPGPRGFRNLDPLPGIQSHSWSRTPIRQAASGRPLRAEIESRPNLLGTPSQFERRA